MLGSDKWELKHLPLFAECKICELQPDNDRECDVLLFRAVQPPKRIWAAEISGLNASQLMDTEIRICRMR